MNLYVKTAGIIMFLFGVSTILFPNIFEVTYGLGMANINSKNLVQSMVGGTEIALSFALLLHKRLDFDLRTVLGLVALILLCIATLRGILMIWFSYVHSIALIECMVEFGSALLLWRARKLCSDGVRV